MLASVISFNSSAVTLDMYIAFILRHVEIFGFHEYKLDWATLFLDGIQTRYT